MERRTAEQNPEIAGRGLLVPRVFRDGVEPAIGELPGGELDLPGRGVEFPLFERGDIGARFSGEAYDPLPAEFVVVDIAGPATSAQVLLAVLPGEVVAEAHPVAQLLGDPPGGLTFKEGLDGRLPYGHLEILEMTQGQGVVPLQIGAFREDHVGPPGDVGREDVDGNQKIEVVDRPDGLGPVREGLDQVAAVYQPRLDRVGLPGYRCLPDGGGGL